MFTRHQRPSPEAIQIRRDRHFRQQALLRVKLKEELLALLDSLRDQRTEPRHDVSRGLYL